MPRALVARLYLHPVDYFSVCVCVCGCASARTCVCMLACVFSWHCETLVPSPPWRSCHPIREGKELITWPRSRLCRVTWCHLYLCCHCQDGGMQTHKSETLSLGTVVSHASAAPPPRPPTTINVTSLDFIRLPENEYECTKLYSVAVVTTLPDSCNDFFI